MPKWTQKSKKQKTKKPKKPHISQNPSTRPAPTRQAPTLTLLYFKLTTVTKPLTSYQSSKTIFSKSVHYFATLPPGQRPFSATISISILSLRNSPIAFTLTTVSTDTDTNPLHDTDRIRQIRTLNALCVCLLLHVPPTL